MTVTLFEKNRSWYYESDVKQQHYTTKLSNLSLNGENIRKESKCWNVKNVYYCE